MLGLDDLLARLGGSGNSLLIALAVALLLGLRHATDPDHLTALTTLVLGDEERGPRRAAQLGLAWGAGHALMLVALGLPVLLLGHTIPEGVQRTAEGLIGVVIVGLALRLLAYWGSGSLGVHGRRAHDAERSPRAAFGIGLVHGAGGSAGIGILLVAGMQAGSEAAAALLLFAAGTAMSMAGVSAAWGRLLVSGAVERRLSLLAPAFGALSLAFGCWYFAGAALG